MLQDDHSDLQKLASRTPKVIGRIDLSKIYRPSGTKQVVVETREYGGVVEYGGKNRIEDDSVDRAWCTMVRHALRGAGAKTEES
jgi:hypothetical protein